MLGKMENLPCQWQHPRIQDKEQDLHQPQHSRPTQVSPGIRTWEGEWQYGVTPCHLPTSMGCLFPVFPVSALPESKSPADSLS